MGLTPHDLLVMGSSRSGSHRVTGQSASLWLNERAIQAGVFSDGGITRRQSLPVNLTYETCRLDLLWHRCRAPLTSKALSRRSKDHLLVPLYPSRHMYSHYSIPVPTSSQIIFKTSARSPKAWTGIVRTRSHRCIIRCHHGKQTLRLLHHLAPVVSTERQRKVSGPS